VSDEKLWDESPTSRHLKEFLIPRPSRKCGYLQLARVNPARAELYSTIKLIETVWRNQIGITMVIMWTSQRSARVSVLIMQDKMLIYEDLNIRDCSKLPANPQPLLRDPPVRNHCFRGFEQLSSSIWRRGIAWGEMQPRVAFEGAKFWFMSHNFGSRYAKKLIKGSKGSYSSQDSNKTLSPKNVPLVRRPGPGKDGQDNAKTPLLVTFPPEKLKSKTKKIFFLSAVQDLLNP